MNATICKRFRFEAAHQLPNHDGKCARLHGHSYVVEVEARGPVRPADGASDEGMVVDFAVLADAAANLRDDLDHSFLNDVLPPPYQPTTAEHLANFILEELRARVPQVTAVRVWETADAYAEARRHRA